MAFSMRYLRGDLRDMCSSSVCDWVETAKHIQEGLYVQRARFHPTLPMQQPPALRHPFRLTAIVCECFFLSKRLEGDDTNTSRLGNDAASRGGRVGSVFVAGGPGTLQDVSGTFSTSAISSCLTFLVIWVVEEVKRLLRSLAKPSSSESRLVTIARSTPVKEVFSTRT